MEVVSDAPAAPPGPRAADLKLNWAAIHALVQEIPKTFRDPSFSNSGRQISRVVTASDPARELEQVKAWQTSLEGIVDELVGTHHGSLSRSIKNYAEIVQLFEVNRANVDTTRAVLNEGRARLVSELNATTEKVRETWRRTLVDREVARKLADLERVTRLPGTARACVAEGDFETAVALIENANKGLRAPAARDARAALADVRRECAATETFAHAAMAREIGHVVFCCDAPCRRDAANVGRSHVSEIRTDATMTTTTQKDADGAVPFATFPSDGNETRRATVARLVGCAARLGAPGLARALEGLRRSVAGEIWTLLAEQIAHGAERADDLEAAARREASSLEDDEKARASSDAAGDDVDADDVFADGVFEAVEVEMDASPRATPHASSCILGVLAAHVCALARAVLANMRALDAELARVLGGASFETETPFAARARETFRAALPLALGGLARAPRLCEGLEGSRLEGLGVRAAPARARDTRAWWHAHDETRGGASETSVSRELVAEAPRPNANFFAFGPLETAEGTERARFERGGDERFARAAAAAARAARVRLGGAGPSTRIFELECVKETLRELELA
jgi:hypothetical protein